MKLLTLNIYWYRHPEEVYSSRPLTINTQQTLYSFYCHPARAGALGRSGNFHSIFQELSVEDVILHLQLKACFINSYIWWTLTSGTKGHRTGRGRRRADRSLVSVIAVYRKTTETCPSLCSRPVTTDSPLPAVLSCPAVVHVLIEMTFFFDPACPGGGSRSCYRPCASLYPALAYLLLV